MAQARFARREVGHYNGTMRFKNPAWMVLTLSFFSGATALVYEVLWSKFLSQMFGSTIYAQTVVLAAFMGGLALGNRLFGRWADRRGNRYKRMAVWRFSWAFMPCYTPGWTGWPTGFLSRWVRRWSVTPAGCWFSRAS